MSVNRLREILDQIQYPVLMEEVDCIWQRDCNRGEITWNRDDSLEDLRNGDGETYSIEPIGECCEYDGYLFINAATGCGETVTYFFNLQREVKV